MSQPARSLALQLCQVGLAGKRMLDRRLRQDRITAAQYAILRALDRNGPAHLRKLARDLALSRQTVMLASRDLVRRDLVRISADDADARVTRLGLTGLGRALLTRLEPRVARIEAQILRAVPAAARQGFQDGLSRLAGSLFLSPRKEFRWAD